MEYEGDKNPHQRPLRGRVRAEVHVPPPKKKRGKFSKPYPVDARQDPREVELYWEKVLPDTMKGIAKLRAEGLKATAIWIDESFVVLNFKLVRVWWFEHKPLYRHVFIKSQKTVLFTGVDLDGNTMVSFGNKANTEEFSRFLTRIIDTYRDYYIVYIFLDNARYHSVILGPFLPNIRFVWLPRYAPQCNFDEQFHRVIKRRIGEYFFTDIEDVKKVLSKFDGERRPSLVKKARKIFLKFYKKFSKGHL